MDLPGEKVNFPLSPGLEVVLQLEVGQLLPSWALTLPEKYGETFTLSFSLITFQRNGSQVFEEDISRVVRMETGGYDGH